MDEVASALVLKYSPKSLQEAGVEVVKEGAEGFYHIGRLTLVAATFCHQVGHHYGRFPPIPARILKFYSAHVGAKYGEKHRDEGLMHVF